METLFVLLPLALLIAAIAVGFFIWAAKTGQFDDLETPAIRILFDDEEPRRKATTAASPAPPGAPGETVPPSKPRNETTADSTRRAPE